MKVLIVGAGIGGLTLAAFLKDSHVQYDIVEKAPDWSRQGFLVSLWDNARDILKKLGLAEKFDADGTRVRTYSIRNGSGRVIRDFDLTSFYADYGSAINVVERSHLHGWLLEKVGAQSVQMGTCVTEIVQHDEKVTAKFSDGRTGEYDVVVGADGVHSTVRGTIFKDCIESYENWRVWYMWIDHDFDIPGIIAEYVEPREFAIVCTAGQKTTGWFFAPADHTIWDQAEGRGKRLRELLSKESFLVPSAIEKIRDEDMMPTDLVQIRLKKWSSGNVVLLGDAAHSLGPHAGIGCTMAMEDGYVLAGELMRVSDLYPLSRALENYEKKRRYRIRRATILTRNIKMGTFVRSKILRNVFNFFIPFFPQRYLFKNLAALLTEEI